MNEETEKLSSDKISTLLFKFSIPAIVGTMINALYNVVDRIFIGNASHVGSGGLAGLTIAFPIMIILLSVGILFGVGGATLYSIRLGQGNRNAARKTLGNSLLFMIVSSLFLMAIGIIFMDPILVAFGASPDVLPYARSYMSIIFYGAIFQVISMGLNNFIRADARPRLAMMTMLIGALSNIVLDWLFIFGFKMGMEGAALATIISQALSMMWTLSYFLRSSTLNRLRFIDLKFDRRILVTVLGYGLPGFLLQINSSILNLILNKTLLQYGGDNAISAMGIVNSVQTFILMPVFGLNQGLKPIVSYNFGAKKFDRIREAMKIANITATIIVVVGWLLTRFFTPQIVDIFSNDPLVMDVANQANFLWFWSLPVIGFQVIASNFFQAVGHYKTAVLLTLCRTTIFLLPLILIFSDVWGLTGIFYAAPIADLFAVSVTATWYFFGIRSLEKFASKRLFSENVA